MMLSGLMLKRFLYFLGIIALSANGYAGGLVTSQALLQEANQQITDIHTEALLEQLQKTPNTVVVDIRTPNEILLTGGMIDAPRSYNIPQGWLTFRIADHAPEPDIPILVYCGTNQRSPLAAQRLMQMGYTNVKNYADGFLMWRERGLPVESMDKALDSLLYSKPQPVTDNVWSAIGATAPPTYANSGHNNNLTFIVTDNGVVLVNAGENYLLAKAMHAAIQQVTDQPVKYVILENGQGHAALGSAYWKEQGAHIIAHADAAHELASRGENILQRIRRNIREKALGTRLVMPDETFQTNRKKLIVGGVHIELLHLGPAHSPGDIMVWLPRQKLMITGDMAFHERLLPIFEHTDTAAWLETWKAFAAFDAEIIIPGHGGPTDMATVTQYTRDYLMDMRAQIAELIEDGGALTDIHEIDQSAYAHLDTYDELAALNASVLFRQMEFE